MVSHFLMLGILFLSVSTCYFVIITENFLIIVQFSMITPKIVENLTIHLWFLIENTFWILYFRSNFIIQNKIYVFLFLSNNLTYSLFKICLLKTEAIKKFSLKYLIKIYVMKFFSVFFIFFFFYGWKSKKYKYYWLKIFYIIIKNVYFRMWTQLFFLRCLKKKAL